MSRRLSQSFRCKPLAELAQQLRFAPAEKRIAQVRRAEKLHDQIDARKTYPVDFIWYRITRYRKEAEAGTLLVGEAVLPDLRLLIDHVSKSVGMPVDDNEEVETAGELAARLGVSTKTLSRWRGLGLRWRWVRGGETGRRHIGYTRSAVEHFLAGQGDRVERAKRFSQMGESGREALIERAREVVAGEALSLNQVAKRLAAESGRSLQAVRLILEGHDKGRVEGAIFRDRRGVLDGQTKRAIVRAYRGGMAAARIAERVGKTRSTVYRAIRERRAEALGRVRLGYVGSALFEREDADEVILGAELPVSGGEGRGRREKKGNGSGAGGVLPGELEHLYLGPGVKPRARRAMLVRYNYLKFKVARGLAGLDPYGARSGDLDRIEGWLRGAGRVRDVLVAGSLVMVLPVARRHLIDQPDPSASHLIELLEECTGVVIEAVETFDTGMVRSFESYVSWRLMQRLAHVSSSRDGRRARRKADGGAALRRIRSAAAARGVRLPVDGEDAEA